jgi:hypothetical protein
LDKHPPSSIADQQGLQKPQSLWLQRAEALKIQDICTDRGAGGK